jgi:hypothetical protein
MAKRSDFKRIERDYYPTPKAAVVPLIPFLPGGFTYCEPCAGDLRLALHLDELTDSNCIMTRAYDIEPQDDGVDQLDATTLTRADIGNADYIITNPPWDRTKKSGYLLHTLIERFSSLADTWLLFDADWAHTVQSEPYMRRLCTDIVSIGRVKWIENSKMTGKDNCAWYQFRSDKVGESVNFWGRNIHP